MAELKTKIKLRNDTTENWNQNSTVVLDKGEVGIEYTVEGQTKLKIGDGTKTWANLEYFGGNSDGLTEELEKLKFKCYNGERQGDEDDQTAIARIINGGEPHDGDICIIKTIIHDDKQSYTSYVYMTDAWVAMDGNYDAENVYFSKDLMTTSAIGNITLQNGQATIPAAGKNLKQVFETIFVKEANPNVTQPSVSITFAAAKAYEVGTQVTPSYSATFNKGSYQYGPDTGVTVSTWEITDTAKHSASEASGSFDQITVEDGTNYTITAKATYGAGATPKTNLGNEYAAGQIKAGSASKTSGAVTGYRNSFYGTTTDKEAAVDSQAIRALTGKSNKALANGAKFDVTIPLGAKRVIIAYPNTLREVTSITDKNGLNAEIKTGFSSTTVDVEGANGASAITYKVYTLDYAQENDTANTYSVTI